MANKSRLFSIVTNTTTQQQCKEFIDKVREFTFIKVRDRQVNKFNRLMHRNNLMARQQSMQAIGNSQVKFLLVKVKCKVLLITTKPING